MISFGDIIFTFLFYSSSMEDFLMGFLCVAALTNDVTHRQSSSIYLFKISAFATL